MGELYHAISAEVRDSSYAQPAMVLVKIRTFLKKNIVN
jgi:hypothetical protein